MVWNNFYLANLMHVSANLLLQEFVNTCNMNPDQTILRRTILNTQQRTT